MGGGARHKCARELYLEPACGLPEPQVHLAAIAPNMPFFETAKIRAARLSLTGKKGKNGDVGKTNPALKRPPSVSPRPYGYRIDSKHPSSPAITMAQQWVRSPKTDPTMPEDFPGPGAYDLIKY